VDPRLRLRAGRRGRLARADAGPARPGVRWRASGCEAVGIRHVFDTAHSVFPLSEARSSGAIRSERAGAEFDGIARRLSRARQLYRRSDCRGLAALKESPGGGTSRSAGDAGAGERADRVRSWGAGIGGTARRQMNPGRRVGAHAWRS